MGAEMTDLIAEARKPPASRRHRPSPEGLALRAFAFAEYRDVPPMSAYNWGRPRK